MKGGGAMESTEGACAETLSIEERIRLYLEEKERQEGGDGLA